MEELLKTIEKLADDLDRFEKMEAYAGKWTVSVEKLTYRIPNEKTITFKRTLEVDDERSGG